MEGGVEGDVEGGVESADCGVMSCVVVWCSLA